MPETRSRNEIISFGHIQEWTSVTSTEVTKIGSVGNQTAMSVE